MSSFLNNFPFETKMGKTKTVAVTKTFCLRAIEVMSLKAMFVFFRGRGFSYNLDGCADASFQVSRFFYCVLSL